MFSFADSQFCSPAKGKALARRGGMGKGSGGDESGLVSRLATALAVAELRACVLTLLLSCYRRLSPTTISAMHARARDTSCAVMEVA